MSIHWFLFVTVVVAAVQAFIFRRTGLKRLTYRRFFSAKACFPGDDIELVEQIWNRKPLPVPWLRLESLIPAGLEFRKQLNLDVNDGKYYQNHRSMFSLMPFTKITRRHSIRCLKRGCFRLGSATLTCGDVLGISSASVHLTIDAELLVYPSPAPLDQIKLPSHSWLGDITVRRWIVEDPFMIAGAREYRYGDPLGGVNWKATARTGKLQVHRKDYTADQRLLVLVNVEDHAKMWDQVNDETLFEQGISYAAAVCRYALDNGMETGFGTNAHDIDAPGEAVRIAPAGGSEQMTALLEAMARLVVARSVPFDELLAQEADLAAPNQAIVIMSAYESDKMSRQIDRLRRHGHTVDIIWLESAEVHSAKAGASA